MMPVEQAVEFFGTGPVSSRAKGLAEPHCHSPPKRLDSDAAHGYARASLKEISGIHAGGGREPSVCTA